MQSSILMYMSVMLFLAARRKLFECLQHVQNIDQGVDLVDVSDCNLHI